MRGEGGMSDPGRFVEESPDGSSASGDDAGQPLVIDDADRYGRLRLIPWWRQEKLAAAKVLVVGAGATLLPVLASGPLALPSEEFALGTFHTGLLAATRYLAKRFAGEPATDGARSDVAGTVGPAVVTGSLVIGSASLVLSLGAGAQSTSAILAGKSGSRRCR